MTPREAAYLALCSTSKGAFIAEYLKQWQKEYSPSAADFNLAQEIAYGTERMRLALDYLALKGSQRNKLTLKPRERILLRTAVYQMSFMDRIPGYAIVNESVNIARKHCHGVFASFLNAVLRKMAEMQPDLPKGKDIGSLSIRYSYPEFFIKELIQDHGMEKAAEILESGNRPGAIMARIRDIEHIQSLKISQEELLPGATFPYARIDSSQVSKLALDPAIYIQNATPGALIEHLNRGMEPPARVLDLCASPGGKLLLAHDLYPKAQLYGNDISQEKIATLQQNMDKYKVQARLSCGPGEQFAPQEKFDLIILDVPCSNTGVLNKRPEARWRLNEENLARLEETQLRLLEHAASLLSRKGEIWYMTCSILKRENEDLAVKACQKFNLNLRTQKTVLPTLEGWDGGFGCALTS